MLMSKMKTTKFKSTELGAIPVDWDVKRIDQCGDVVTGSTPPRGVSELWGGSFNWISAKDFKGKFIVSSEEKVTEAGERYCRTLPANSVLVTCIASIGLNAIAKRPCATNQQINAVICRDCDYEYFYYQCCFNESRLRQMAGQTAVPIIGKRQFEEFTIALPKEIKEQRRIAGALSDVDELISALGKLIEKKRNIKTGAMQELLGMRNEECGMRNVPRRRLAGFSGEWVEKRLGDCGSFSKGAGISRAQANSGRIPAVRYGELYTTHHEYIKAFESFISDDVARCSTRLTRGDIVFACSGETKEEIGKCAAFLGDEIAYAGGDLLILSPKEAYDSKFLAFELNTPFCASQKAAAGQGDAVVHIRQHSLEELIVCIPSTLAEQKAIAAVLSDIDAEIAALEADRAKYERIKSGMMQELLTGKTRLAQKEL